MRQTVDTLITYKLGQGVKFHDGTDFSGSARAMTSCNASRNLQKAGLPTSQVWQEVADRIEVKVDSWMLPGHAVTGCRATAGQARLMCRQRSDQGISPPAGEEAC